MEVNQDLMSYQGKFIVRKKNGWTSYKFIIIIQDKSFKSPLIIISSITGVENVKLSTQNQGKERNSSIRDVSVCLKPKVSNYDVIWQLNTTNQYHLGWYLY